MDGRTRLFSLALLLLATLAPCSLAVAQDDDKSSLVEMQLYKTGVMDREFLGAVIIDLRIEEPKANQALSGEIELRSKNEKKTPKYKSRFVSVSLEPLTPTSGSGNDGRVRSSKRYLYYVWTADRAC